MQIIVTTAAELKDLLKECLSDIKTLAEPIKPKVSESKNLHSIKELAEFLGCSLSTAMRLKNSGKIRYKQFGRKVIFNTREVVEDINNKRRIVKNG